MEAELLLNLRESGSFGLEEADPHEGVGAYDASLISSSARSPIRRPSEYAALAITVPAAGPSYTHPAIVTVLELRAALELAKKRLHGYLSKLMPFQWGTP